MDNVQNLFEDFDKLSKEAVKCLEKEEYEKIFPIVQRQLEIVNILESFDIGKKEEFKENISNLKKDIDNIVNIINDKKVYISHQLNKLLSKKRIRAKYSSNIKGTSPKSRFINKST